MKPIRVVLHATDPLSLSGLTSVLDARPEVVVLGSGQRAEADVAVASVDRFTAEVVSVLRRSAMETDTPVVLITGSIEESELLTAVECRVVAILPRRAANGERLLHAIQTVAAGGGIVPSDLLGHLLEQVGRLQREVLAPNGLNAAVLTSREADVLRLIADGFDAGEIANRLCYSERTVKNVIYGITHRLKLKNRAHAVAYALRAGMI